MRYIRRELLSEVGDGGQAAWTRSFSIARQKHHELRSTRFLVFRICKVRTHGICRGEGSAIVSPECILLQLTHFPRRAFCRLAFARLAYPLHGALSNTPLYVARLGRLKESIYTILDRRRSALPVSRAVETTLTRDRKRTHRGPGSNLHERSRVSACKAK